MVQAAGFDRKERMGLFAVFLVWPAALLYKSIRFYRSSHARNALLFFIAFFGFTFVARHNNDAFRYIEWFQDIRATNISLKEFFSLLYSEDTSYLDVVEPLLAFIVAQFTGDHRVLFAVFGLVLGYFYTRNIWYLIDKAPGEHSIYAKLLLLTFAVTVPFWNLNVIRFWTAGHLFFYGTIRFLMENRRSALLIAASAMLIHFSYILPITMLLLYALIGSRTRVFLLFFIICNLVSELNVSQLRDPLIAYTPVAFHNRIEGYTQEDNIERRREDLAGRNWYARMHTKALHLAASVLLLLVFFKGKEVWEEQRAMRRFFSFVLFFGGFSSLSSLVPVLMRFHTLGLLFFMAFLFFYFYYKKDEVMSDKALVVLLPAFALFFLVSVRIGFDNASIYAFISNPLIAPVIEINDVTLIDFIK